AAPDSAGLTPRERELLERIEKLERRLAQVEAVPLLPAPIPSPAPPVVTVQAQPAAASEAGEKPGKPEPFAFADFTWLTGNSRQKDFPLDTKVFTGEVRVDTAYHYSFNHPNDDTITGSTEVFRHNEIQLTELGFGGDFHWQNLRARVLTQFGLYSQTQPRNDASPSEGQHNLDNPYPSTGEAYGGYHIDKLNGINIDGGLFLSYIGLFSFHQF